MLNELKNILDIKQAYKEDSIKGFENLTLYLLKVKDTDRVFNASLCLCKSEVEAQRLIYEVEFNYKTKKIYTLELEENDYKIDEIKKLTLKEVFEDKELKSFLQYRFSEKITPYSYEDLELIGRDYKLIWDIDTNIAQFLVLKKDKITLPKDTSDMPFYFNGNARVMVKDNKFGIINSKKMFSQMDYKIWIDFRYHYIRSDGFGNFELLEDEIITNDFKKLKCKLLKADGKVVENVLLNSTTNDEYITTKNDMLLYHKDKITSKPYKNIILNAFEIKPVMCENNLFGYIDKNLDEMIPCKFNDWNFFNDGYCVLKDNDRYFVIDTKGNFIIKDMHYIKHFNDELFFVKKDTFWGVYKKDKIFIDFFDLQKEVKSIKNKNNLDEDEDEVFEFLQEKFMLKTGISINASGVKELILRSKILEKNSLVYKKIYEIPLKEYIKNFNLKTRTDLVEARLWGKKVKTKDGKIGYIGWEYPSSASLYDMSVELPVDGFGIKLEDLELI